MYKIAIVGDCYGEADEAAGKPFLGSAGQELDRILIDAGIRREDCFLTNVFNFRPVRGDFLNLFGKKASVDTVPGLPPIALGKYLQSPYGPELVRLHNEIEEAAPNLIVALGNAALWAILGKSAISKNRGTCSYSSPIAGGSYRIKTLPTYHPSAILRQYDLRHTTVLDFMKAKREAEFPELRRPLREIWTEPDLDDLEIFYERFLKDAEVIAFDVETAFEQITCISFAPSPSVCLVVPIIDYRFPGNHYWKTQAEELAAWLFVERVLQTPSHKVGQNVLYDIQYLWRQYGISVAGRVDDTMLCHHSLLPESEKSLAFLGSIYTNEIAWKPMRPRGKHAERREDE